MFPTVEVLQAKSTRSNLLLILTLAEVTSNAIFTTDEIQTNLNSLSQVVIDNCILQIFLPASQGGVCAVANPSCST